MTCIVSYGYKTCRTPNEAWICLCYVLRWHHHTRFLCLLLLHHVVGNGDCSRLSPVNDADVASGMCVWCVTSVWNVSCHLHPQRCVRACVHACVSGVYGFRMKCLVSSSFISQMAVCFWRVAPLWKVLLSPWLCHSNQPLYSFLSNWMVWFLWTNLSQRVVMYTVMSHLTSTLRVVERSQEIDVRVCVRAWVRACACVKLMCVRVCVLVCVTAGFAVYTGLCPCGTSWRRSQCSHSGLLTNLPRQMGLKRLQLLQESHG